MGNEPIWKVERQPAWLVVAIKKTITDLPGGYAEAAEWLGVTENALFNRLRVDGDQIFPLGWAMVLQRAGGSTHIADAVARHSNFVRKATADGVIDADERAQIEENSYQVIAKFQEHVTLLYRVFCVAEKSDARECAAPGALANNSSSMEK